MHLVIYIRIKEEEFFIHLEGGQVGTETWQAYQYSALQDPTNFL